MTALYTALVSLAEKDEGVAFLKNSCERKKLCMGISGSRKMEGAFNMLIQGIKDMERKYPSKIELRERIV